MKRQRQVSFRFGALLLIALAAGLPAGLRAQGAINFSSSMTAECIVSDCSLVRFTLNSFQNDIHIDMIRLRSHIWNGSPWDFEGFSRVWSGNGTVLFDENAATNAWQYTVRTWDNVTLTGSGMLAAQPIYLDVRMSSWGSTPDLWDNNLSYDATGADIVTGDLAETRGMVTPEPATIALLGSGLVGLAGAARRRRRLSATDPDA